MSRIEGNLKSLQMVVDTLNDKELSPDKQFKKSLLHILADISASLAALVESREMEGVKNE